jgi:hypothetical protein
VGKKDCLPSEERPNEEIRESIGTLHTLLDEQTKGSYFD